MDDFQLPDMLSEPQVLASTRTLLGRAAQFLGPVQRSPGSALPATSGTPGPRPTDIAYTTG
ncbi:hypothetical protein [Streptomyces sp. HUAS TT20]|uniref:hypothetical protein n=1 Tax=Streptomyces sp. HUAS TT20 TaxID=3447509 RepID=UPI0021D7E018|nr:hypothetical protein [Streptomyces sp. HUAS 15-9]UXY28703.1 hypothetical protein N8I87_20515 [Streptomyces sp. HUAS 15-9]